MMYKSHVALTILFVVILSPMLHINPILFLLVAVFATLLPDIDHANSKLGRKVPLVSFFFKHRGFLHSLFPPIILYVVFAFIYEPIGIALFVGYVSHLIGDAVTEHGIRPFHPFSKLRIRGFLHTNSFGEKLLFFFIIFLIAFFLLRI